MHDHTVFQLVLKNFTRTGGGLSHLVGNPMTTAAIKKIIYERLSYETVNLSLLHLHVERAT